MDAEAVATPPLVDSHCHLDFPEFEGRLEEVRSNMRALGIGHALCISVDLAKAANVIRLAERFDNFFASVGAHPNHDEREHVSEERLLALASHPKVVAVGETGLDYYRSSGDLEWQRERFRIHIRAARRCGKPLVVHSRDAEDDTLRILREEGAEAVGGVLHCFTGSLEMAEAAIALGFHISFSGILTFRNAQTIREVAKVLPLERLLVETDSPYLAPVPFRGQVNQPAWVRYVAEELARLKELTLAQVASATSANFFRLFKCPT